MRLAPFAVQLFDAGQDADTDWVQMDVAHQFGSYGSSATRIELKRFLKEVAAALVPPI
jgi:hypothetical protein